MSFPEEEEESLVELGINVHDYKSYQASQFDDILSFLKTLPKYQLRPAYSGLAA
jgi:hypothetical protein